METFTDMLINIAAGCGLHCSTCSLYIGTTEEQWDKEVRKKYTCSSCGTLNSAYDLACRKCSTSPSSDYVKKYQNEIIAAIKR